MDVSVVIATYNRKSLLKKCLECLFYQDYPKDKYEIILVDDGSTDGTDKMVFSLKPPCKMVYFQNPERLGQSKARNKGISRAEGRVIIFVDSDVFAPPWFIKEHAKSHKKSSKLIVDGPAINVSGAQNLSNPPFDSLQVKILAFFDLWGAHFITANTSCLRENIVFAGGFDENFGKGFGWQDRELGLRLEKMGLKRIKNRKAYVLHYREKNKNKIDLEALWQKQKDRGENAILYYKKHPTKKVKREARFRYLIYSHILENLGLGKKNLTSEHMASLLQKGNFCYHILRKPYLIHAYAEGLREGMKKHKMENL